MIRRNLRITYIIENNGVYGLTKGQFSATADRGTRQKRGAANPWEAIDIAALAILMGATFVARSFSGDRKQLAPLIEAALNHKGTAVLDVLSPCVTFNDHEGSTKSLKNIRANRDVLHDIDFIPDFDQVEADYEEGTEIRVRMHEAGMITLHKIKDHDPRDRAAATQLVEQARAAGKFATGLIYIDEDAPDFAEVERLPEVPLAFLGEDELRPSREALESINASLML
jgi:2-oxoglutarate ferredoxin oxidoreductase subunit beta